VTSKYPGVVQLVARDIWEQDAPLSSQKIPCPQSLDTPAIQALPPQAEMVKKNRLTTCLTTSGAKLNNQKSGISAVGSALALGARQRSSDLPESKCPNPLTHRRLRLFRNFRNRPKIRL